MSDSDYDLRYGDREQDWSVLADRALKAKAVLQASANEVGDDVCWIDTLEKLAEIFEVDVRPWTLPKEQMMANCSRYIDCIKAKQPYVKDDETLAVEAGFKRAVPAPIRIVFNGEEGYKGGGVAVRTYAQDDGRVIAQRRATEQEILEEIRHRELLAAIRSNR